MYADTSYKHIDSIRIYAHTWIDLYMRIYIYIYRHKRINTHTYIDATILIKDRYMSVLDRGFTPRDVIIPAFHFCFKWIIYEFTNPDKYLLVFAVERTKHF